MNVGFAQVETIMNTLPIGYYAGRRVNVSLEDNIPTSTYSTMEDKIVISYPAIAHRMAQVAENADVEEAVRSMLYHEVSHAILTDDRLRSDTIYNIFEDERIETVLKDYYMNVDFKKQLWEMCGQGIPTATTPEQAFFNAVRFRCAPDDIKNDINQMIKKYATLHRGDNSSEWWDYGYDIKRLYNKIVSAFRKNPQDFQPQEDQQANSDGEQRSTDRVLSGQGKGQGKGQKTEQGEGQEQDASEQGESADQSSEGQNQNGQASESSAQNGQKSYKPIATESPLNPEQLQKMVGASLRTTPVMSNEQAKQLAEFTKTAEMIIGNFNKKNAGGSGVNAYSGVFNPRAVVRQDYRFFERAMTTQGNNKFGTCHLNLFIDSSGSMCRNQDLVNGILASLSEIERKNRNFTMSVSFIDDEYHECETVRDRVYHTGGGNTIPSDMKELFLKRQLPNTCNYNIVLFDGDAICNESLSAKEQVRRFSAFDYKQTTLIIDPDNKPYLGTGFKNAKVIITQDYTEELIDHITKALMIAFG